MRVGGLRERLHQDVCSDVQRKRFLLHTSDRDVFGWRNVLGRSVRVPFRSDELPRWGLHQYEGKRRQKLWVLRQFVLECHARVRQWGLQTMQQHGPLQDRGVLQQQHVRVQPEQCFAKLKFR